MVAYVKSNNLYVQDVHTFQITPLTTDGSSTVINGTFDWVYEEEFRLRCGFRWSPDSKSIAFWQLDQSGVRVVNLINNTDHLYPQLVPIPYPKAGEMNPGVRIGVVSVVLDGDDDDDDDVVADHDDVNSSKDGTLDNAKGRGLTGGGVAGGRNVGNSANNYDGNIAKKKNGTSSSSPKINWIHLPGDPRNHYIASLDWIPNSKELVFQRLNRLQNTVHVIVAEVGTGNIRVVFTGEFFC